MMRCAFLVEPGQVEIRHVSDPEPAPGEVVLKVECALTGGTDLKAYRRGHPLIPMPGPFGHQYSGRVAMIGSGVRGWSLDAPVMGANSAPCGECDSCQRQRYSLCRRLTEQLVFGAFAEYVKIPARVVQQNLLPRPEKVSASRAAFLEPVSCVMHGLRLIQWKEVHRVLILGLGSMGLLFARLIPRVSAAEVFGVGRGVQRLELARQSGLKEVLDAGAEEAVSRLRELDGFDCVIECTGQMPGWRQAVDFADPGAQVLLFGGLPRGTRFEVDTYRLHYEELKLIGSFHFGPSDVRRAVELLQSEDFVVEDLVSGPLSLEQLPQALEWMSEGRGIKYAIDPWC